MLLSRVNTETQQVLAVNMRNSAPIEESRRKKKDARPERSLDRTGNGAVQCGSKGTPEGPPHARRDHHAYAISPQRPPVPRAKRLDSIFAELRAFRRLRSCTIRVGVNEIQPGIGMHSRACGAVQLWHALVDHDLSTPDLGGVEPRYGEARLRDIAQPISLWADRRMEAKLVEYRSTNNSRGGALRAAERDIRRAGHNLTAEATGSEVKLLIGELLVAPCVLGR